MLETELVFYEQHRAEWATQYAGKYVLVKDAMLVGVFDTLESALTEGTHRFRLESYLVRPVNRVEREFSAPALTLGLLHADPAHAVCG